MPFCSHCGRKIEGSGAFCGFCGKPVVSVPQAAPAPVTQQQTKRKPIGLIIGISAGASVLLIGALLATVLLVTNKKPSTFSERAETTVSKKENVKTLASTPTPIPATTTTTETTVDPNLLTNEQAEAAIENYILINYPDVKTAPATCYWGLDANKTTQDTAVVFFRSYTGAHLTYYIDRATGETYETSYLPNIDPDKPEEKTGVTFNIRDYLNKSESTPTPTPTSTPTPATVKQTLRKVTVSDAYNKTYKSKYDDYKVTDRVPKITIVGVNTSAINKEIYNKCKSHFKYGGMSYSYYVGKTYISIIIRMEPVASDPRIEVFNVSRVSGKKLSRKQMLKLLGLTSKKFEARTKKAIKKSWQPAIKEGVLKREREANSFYKESLSKKTLKRAIPCVNSKGKLCFCVKSLPVYGGSGYDDTCLPC